MAIVNTTRYSVGEHLHLDEVGHESVTVVVKATFTVEAQSSACRLADDQEPIRFADQLVNPDAEWSSVFLPSDLCPPKAGADVMVAGRAFLPGSVTSVDVAVGVGSVLAPLRVHGPRLFALSTLGVMVGEAKHVDTVPLIYEKAYGGRSSDPNCWEERNPSGVGVAAKERELDGKPAPQIEHPERPHRKASDRHAPMGYAPIPSHWSPRKEYFGTVDKAWQRSRMPLLPQDFDRRFHNCAHPSLLLESPLRGGERVATLGLCEAQRWSFELPQFLVNFHARYDQSQEERVGDVDTLILFPENSRFELICRTTFRLGRRNRLRVIQIVD